VFEIGSITKVLTALILADIRAAMIGWKGDFRDPTGFAGHSLRSGFATSAARGGVDLAFIAPISGCWCRRQLPLRRAGPG
jgi:hypothetical protein